MTQKSLIKRGKIKAIYYGDPLCSTCWTNEPYLKKFLLEYGSTIDIEYRMGGLLKSFDSLKSSTNNQFNSEYLRDLWNTTGKQSGMSIEGDIWTEKPIASSYPASLAFYAAQKQSPNKALSFLRILREMLFLKKKDISQANFLRSAAKFAGLDASQLEKDIKSDLFNEKFEKDIKDRKKWKVEVLPTMVLMNEEGQTILIEEIEAYEQWEKAINQLGFIPLKKNRIKASPFELLQTFHYLASKEIAVILDRSIESVERELDELHLSGIIIKERQRHANFWRKKESIFSIAQTIEPSHKAIVLGGGIAGLSAAVNLKKVGFNVQVYERSSASRSNGLGFLMLKNGIEAFNLMGLKSKLEKFGHDLNHFVAVDREGTKMHRKDLDSFIGVNRDHCIRILKAELDRNQVHYNKNFSHLEYDKNGEAIGVWFSDGSYEAADLIVGADGIHSAVRRELFPEYDLKRVGYREIVCMTKMPQFEGRIVDTFYKIQDNQKAMGIIPFGSGQFIWFLQFTDEISQGLSNDASAIKDFALKTTADWPIEFQQIAQKSNYEKSYLWNIKRMDLLPQFHKHGVILLGDAAHPLISFTSQGANSAIEDSMVLAHFLSKQGNIKAMKRSFEGFNNYRHRTIKEYIDKGDVLLKQFVNHTEKENFKYPFALSLAK